MTWISQFKYGNIDNKDYQKEIIDVFVNSVYIYDDKIVFTPRGWIEKMENKTLAESIIDRVEPLSYKINLQGETSMRKILAEELLVIE